MTCTNLPGDVNGDGVVDQRDVDLLFGWVSYVNLRNTTYKLACPENADVTGDGNVNIGDAILLANHVAFPGDPRYALRPPTPEPEPDPGIPILPSAPKPDPIMRYIIIVGAIVLYFITK